MTRDVDVPDNWSVISDEVAAYVWKVTAMAVDGRRIEATGSDEDQLLQNVFASIKDSDRQIREFIKARQAATLLPAKE